MTTTTVSHRPFRALSIGAALLLVAVTVSGCAMSPGQQSTLEGAGVGAAGGAALGAIGGAIVGNPGMGAAIGAATGSLLGAGGGYLYNRYDQQQQQQQAQSAQMRAQLAQQQAEINRLKAQQGGN